MRTVAPVVHMLAIASHGQTVQWIQAILFCCMCIIMCMFMAVSNVCCVYYMCMCERLHKITT